MIAELRVSERAGDPNGIPLVLLHGMQESARSWRDWLPELASRRVLMPDLPGHGRSPAPPAGYQWSIAGLASDVAAALAKAGVGPLHLVAAKLGGPIAVEFAVRRPESIASLTLVGAPLSTVGTGGSVDLKANLALQAGSGTKAFIAATQTSRLGSGADPELVSWLSALMAETEARSALAVARLAADGVDVTPLLAELRQPVLIIASSRSGLLPLDRAGFWVAKIPDARLEVIDSDAYHVAVARAAECAAATLGFITAVEADLR